MKLSIVIPAYNEEKRIKDTIEDVNQYLALQNYGYEIIVVNDGSCDKTKEIVAGLIEKIPNLKLIDNNINQGKGASVRKGMLAASGDYRLFMDADNAIKINHLDLFLPHVEKRKYEVVIGSIQLKGARREEEYSGINKIYRTLLGVLSKHLIRIVTIWEIPDTQRAFKLFSSYAAKEIFSRQTIMRWGFDIEVLIIAKKQGYRIKQLPVTWINPSGRVNFKSYLNTLKELSKIKWNSLKGKYD